MSDPSLPPIIVYSTRWCPDCFRLKNFLRERGVAFKEINIEGHPEGEDVVVRVNHGKRKVPTVKFGERYFAASPFRAHQVAEELGIRLNP